MRVSFIGNVCNYHYVLAKFLRRAGLDAHVYYPEADPQQRPESEDPELAGAPVDWLHPLPSPQLSLLRKFDVLPDNLLEELRRSDLLHVHGFEITWAEKTGKPFIWHPFGSDFYMAPVLGWRKPEFPYVRNPLTMQAIRAMRRAITRSDRIIMAWYDQNWLPGYRLLDRLKQWPKIVRLPVPIDTSRFGVREGHRRWPDGELSEQLDTFDLVIFHPTRQLFTPRTVAEEGSKGNDIFYRALADLVHRHGAAVGVVIVDKGDFDTPAAKDLIRKLGLEANVIWVPRMPRHQLIAWYQAADLVADGLYAGALGLIPIEAMACGTPVMMRMDVESDMEFFQSPYAIFEELPPVINVARESELIEAVLHYMRDRDALHNLGRRSRRWVLDHIDGPALAPRYVELYQDVLSGVR